MSGKGNLIALLVGLLVASAIATPLADSEKDAKDPDDIEFDYDGNLTDDDGRNIIIPTANGGLGVTFGFLNTTALSSVFSLGLGTGLTGFTGIFGLILLLGVAAAITLAIVLPIAIGVGVYKKLVEEETGFSGSGAYGGSSYAGSAPSSYAAPSYAGFSEQSSYAIHRSLEDAAKKYVDTKE